MMMPDSPLTETAVKAPQKAVTIIETNVERRRFH